MLLKEAFADTDSFRSHFNEFIVVDEFQRIFERHAHRLSQNDVFVSAGRPNIGELLCLEGLTIRSLDRA